MTESKQISDGAELNSVDEAADAAQPRKTFDKGFLRNTKIVLGIFGVALFAVGYIAWQANSTINDSRDRKGAGQTVVPRVDAGQSVPSSPTEADLGRMNRVGVKDSDEAGAAGKTFIPKDMPMLPQNDGPAANQGPGRGYNASTGNMGSGAYQQDQRRDSNIQAGLERQLTKILNNLDAPGTGSADAYTPKNQQATAKQADGSPGVGNRVGAVSNPQDILIPGLEIVGAELTSPLDTAKTEFLSARITTGPAAGAIVYGTGQVVGEEGVRFAFNQMRWGQKTYLITGVGLDTKTSSDAMRAEVDRRRFERYVVPVFAAAGQAYLNAIARPQQQVVIGGNSVPVVVTPESSAKQATAAGVGAAIGKLGEAFAPKGPNPAFLPEGSPIGILFMAPVVNGPQVATNQRQPQQQQQQQQFAPPQSWDGQQQANMQQMFQPSQQSAYQQGQQNWTGQQQLPFQPYQPNYQQGVGR